MHAKALCEWPSAARIRLRGVPRHRLAAPAWHRRRSRRRGLDSQRDGPAGLNTVFPPLMTTLSRAGTLTSNDMT